jgi:hypothetical protein
MKKFTYNLLLAGCLVITGSARADLTVTVNTADNTDFTAGMTNFVTALNIVSNNGGGATINFNIPGTGIHHIVTPLFGYYGYGVLPVWTNVTINGYSQPGSSPNTHSITQANNAVISIYLASTNGECTDLTGLNGYSGEGAVLPLLSCTNINITGLGFLGIQSGGDRPTTATICMRSPWGALRRARTSRSPAADLGWTQTTPAFTSFQKDITSYGAKVEGTNVIGVAPRSANPQGGVQHLHRRLHITCDLGGNNDSPFYVMGNFFRRVPRRACTTSILTGSCTAAWIMIVEAICRVRRPGHEQLFRH